MTGMILKMYSYLNIMKKSHPQEDPQTKTWNKQKENILEQMHKFTIFIQLINTLLYN